MRSATHDEIRVILKQHDIEANAAGVDGGDFDELVDELDRYFESRESRRAVLGIDIYQYSNYDSRRQRLIPVVFKLLYDLAVRDVRRREPGLFAQEQLSEAFISTGDGGFQTLSTPLHAVVLCVWFQAALNSFNTGINFPRLRRFVGPLTLRYALTYDMIVRFTDNYYGPAIINNARIMSRDTLNRFLLDEASVNWFLDRIGGIENLSILRNEDLLRIPELELDPTNVSTATRAFRDRTDEDLRSGATGFRTVMLQKIGTIAVKKTVLDVYSCYFQLGSSWTDPTGQVTRRLLVTVGNLNASGLA